MPTYKFTWPKPIDDCGDCPCFNESTEWCKAGNGLVYRDYLRPADCPLQEVSDEPANP